MFGRRLLLGNVHREGHRSVCRRDAVHDGVQGSHVALLRGLGGAQQICVTEAKGETTARRRGPTLGRWRRALTLAAVALRALLRGAAPLGAAAAGAAGAGLAG